MFRVKYIKDYTNSYYQNTALVNSPFDCSAIRYFKNGRLHNESGPAIEVPEYKVWYINGLVHREDGPAIEWSNGSKHWYKEGAFLKETYDNFPF